MERQGKMMAPQERSSGERDASPGKVESLLPTAVQSFACCSHVAGGYWRTQRCCSGKGTGVRCVRYWTLGAVQQAMAPLGMRIEGSCVVPQGLDAASLLGAADDNGVVEVGAWCCMGCNSFHAHMRRRA
jgi:hypothetical protein